jgi:hypothetical protein
MPEQPSSESDNASAGPEPEASFSTNGTQPEDAAASAPEVEAADATTTEDAVVAEGGDAAAGSLEASADATSASADSSSSSGASDDPAAFLSELVRAMQTTAGAERARIASETDRRRDEHLATIQARRESAAQKMRDLAAEDLKAIDSWAEAERQRIQLERERRAAALDDDLKKSLAEHGARVDAEMERVEAAIGRHRIEVDEFFAVLDRETDPVAIAQHASRRPVFPTLDEAADAGATPAASGDGTASTEPADSAKPTEAAPVEPTPIGVMDTHPGAKLAASFAAWNAATPAGAKVEAPAEPPAGETPTAEAADAPTPVAVAHDAHDPGPGTILHAVPSGRPLSWLRRDRDSNDRPDGA